MPEGPFEEAPHDEALQALFAHRMANIALPLLVFPLIDPGPLCGDDGETVGIMDKQYIVWNRICEVIRSDDRFRYLDLDDAHIRQNLWIFMTLFPLSLPDDVNRIRTRARRALIEWLDPALLDTARSEFPEAF